MNKFFVLLVSAVLCFGLSGCSSDGEGGIANPFTSSNHPKIEELDWKVKEGVYDDERQLLFSYTNNSDYDIVKFGLKFKQKDGLSDEQLSMLDQIKQKEELTDDVKEIYLGAPTSTYADYFIDAGDTLTSKPCELSGSYYGVSENPTIEYYDMMELDIAYIEYLFDGKIYSLYYDFKNKEYTENGSREAFEWSTSELASLLPQPKLKVGNVDIDYDNIFSFKGTCVDKKIFDDYVEEVKNMGFTIDSYNSDAMYHAKNAEGYDVLIDYNDLYQSLSVGLEKPE